MTDVDGQAGDWTEVDTETRADGDNDLARRSIEARQRTLTRDPGQELRWEVVCSGDGVAFVRLLSRPAAPRLERRKPRHPR